ncbi:ribosome maturation factor RimP [Nocardioides aurantiacus]|uniref:ribosome maturation factor RimP n=1 Tax=Nocardioides aurantiacus TaxID=86796 RepID=UPI00403F31D1
MSASDTGDRLAEELVAPMLALGLDLEAIDVSAAGKRRVLRVAVDKDGGVTMDEIAEATREVSRVLDERGLMGERAYTLEVSSRGVDRPLTLPRHWRRNVGRLVKVAVAGEDEVTGRLLAADEEGVELDVAGSPRRVALSQVTTAKVQIEFTKHEES